VSTSEGTGDGRGSMKDEIIDAGCLSNADMLMLTFQSESASKRTLEHLRTCDTCTGRLATLRRVIAELAANVGSEPESAGPGPSCLNEVALARLVDRDAGTPATRDEMAHLIGCAHCRSELASLASLVDDPGIADEIRAAEAGAGARPNRARSPRYPWPKLVGALATAAVVVLVARVATTRMSATNTSLGGADTVHRAPTITALEAPKSLFPIGDVEAARNFAWTAVSGSDRYRLTLYDNSGHVLYEAQVTDTTLALPDTVRLSRGVPYVWQVEARTAIDRWTNFETTEFVIVAHRALR
jgi:hypothetical protein